MALFSTLLDVAGEQKITDDQDNEKHNHSRYHSQQHNDAPFLDLNRTYQSFLTDS